MKPIALIALIVFSAAACGALPGVHEIKTAPGKLTDAELSSLLEKHIAAADVIAIGESVHGSAGFLAIQTRLIRYLVERQGLRLIVWENPTLRSLELADWVFACTRKQTPPPLDVLYMPTASDLPLWNWICDYNRKHPNNPIVFRGMDIWDRPWEHFARIRGLGASVGIAPAVLKTVALCPAYRSSTWDEIEGTFAALARDGTFLPASDYERCRTALGAVLEASRQIGLNTRQRERIAANDAFELAISASTLLGWLGFYNHQWSHDVLGWNERDRAQGRNMMLAMERHGASRALLSAHTSHVSHGRSRADWWGYGDLKSGVFFFAEATGKKVFNIALTAYLASGTQGEWSVPIAENSIDKTLYEAGHVFSFFTASAAFLSRHPRWWMQNGNFPGAYESGVEIRPRDHFDAFFFLARSRLDKAFEQRPMWQP